MATKGQFTALKERPTPKLKELAIQVLTWLSLKKNQVFISPEYHPLGQAIKRSLSTRKISLSINF